MSTATQFRALAPRRRVTHRRQTGQLSGLATARVDIGVDIAPKEFLGTPDARTVQAGEAEGGTCAHRALTVRTRPGDTMDWAGRYWPAWMRLVLFHTAGSAFEPPPARTRGKPAGWPRMGHATV
jgi:hypothetical protein